jgi:hypothetical protein
MDETSSLKNEIPCKRDKNVRPDRLGIPNGSLNRAGRAWGIKLPAFHGHDHTTRGAPIPRAKKLWTTAVRLC